MRRTHRCGELRETHVGQRVILQGWVHRQRDHGGLVFIDLRDREGWTQVVCNPERAPQAHEVASAARAEYVVEIEGEVVRRPQGTENPDLATGAIEVAADRFEVLNPSLPPPFSIAEEGNVEEPLRLTYRYLDLRRPRMAQNLQLRHRVVKYIRDFLDQHGFLEVETPILTKSTPEGARDYLVPSRIHPGEFYALPQSPQQYKQLLMVAGVDRYFQIARCFRDEDLRADRQPEFTQLDAEMAFVEPNDVLDLMEELYTGLAETFTNRRVSKPFARLTYQEAMSNYGSDKPDLRYGLASVDVSDLLTQTEFGVFRSVLEAGGKIRGLAVPGGAAYSRKQIDDLVEIARTQGAKGLAWWAVESSNPSPRSTFVRFLSEGERGALVERLQASDGDLVLLVADQGWVPSRALGAIRIEVARQHNLADPNALVFARVTEFPLVEWDENEQRWDAVHHPFTSPVPEDIPLMDTDPGAVRARAYDIVCNGWEMGGGSIRIHDRELQSRMFALLGIDQQRAEAQFGHMLRAFQYGAPPHGGIAFGIDRTVAILAGETSIREVIAFPKNQSAADLMMDAPSPVTEAQLRELHIALRQPLPR